jgi:aldehyde:ferredoxin oxidoreductase
MKGFHSKILHIDLTKKIFREEDIDESIYRGFLGGKGLGTYLLLEHTSAGVDPLSADNAIIFATGPVTDTKIWGSSRLGAFTKSPLTGGYMETYTGGRVAEPASRTGYDAIVFKGASERPVYLEITNGKVLFHDAAHLWGKDTYETEDAITEEVGQKNAGVIVIGPAGENLVSYAVIENNYWRSLGRGGAGAVMGAKKVKGIAFYGDIKKELAHPQLVDELWKEMRDVAKENPGVKKYLRDGTLQMIPVQNKVGAFPTKYWTRGTCDNWQNLTMEALREKCNVRSHACSRCFIACGKVSEVLEGRYKGIKIEGPEYETVGVFGGLCLVDDITAIAYLNDICDRIGIDTISAGNVAGFAIEASHRKDLGFKIEYGDVDAIAELLHKIGRREGIGDILAKGVRAAAKEWGLEDLAIHVKGMEPPAYDPRTEQGMALAFATSPRGACHLRATVYKAELSGMIPLDQSEGKARILIDFEDRHTLFDAMILCRFFRDLYSWEKISEIIYATTGMKLDKKQMQKTALSISNKTREFNLRQGLSKSDDSLPAEFFKPLEDSGRVLSKSDFERMLSDYYELKGWN